MSPKLNISHCGHEIAEGPSPRLDWRGIVRCGLGLVFLLWSGAGCYRRVTKSYEQGQAVHTLSFYDMYVIGPCAGSAVVAQHSSLTIDGHCFKNVRNLDPVYRKIPHSSVYVFFTRVPNERGHVHFYDVITQGHCVIPISSELSGATESRLMPEVLEATNGRVVLGSGSGLRRKECVFDLRRGTEVPASETDAMAKADGPLR